MQDNILYDVAIIGGGLAGLTLAIQCVDAGHSVILFEKEQYPYHKVCGEYISMESRNFLLQLGLPLNDMNLPKLTQLQLSDVQGNIYEFDLPLGGFGISRYTLDTALYRLALKKGVHILTNCKVHDIIFSEEKFTIFTASNSWQSKTAAGSFGKRSNLDVKWNRNFIQSKPGKLNNYIGVKYHIRFSHADNVIALHNFHNGYCGISRIEDDTCCLCYLTTANNLTASGNSIKAMQDKILFRNPQLKKIFAEAEFLYTQPLTISQVNFKQKSQVENHVLLIGDAAGMITPLCGNGMSMAMNAGRIAFETLHRFLHHEISWQQVEQEYIRRWRKQFRLRLWVGRLVQRLFGNKGITAVFLKAMKSMPWLAKQVIRSTHGKPF